MTLDKLIASIDRMKPNAYTRQEKIDWVNQLDGMVKVKVIDTHEQDEETAWESYTDKDGDATLLVAAPFDKIYIHWLEAQIDYSNAEYGKYNNSISLYNTMWSEYVRWYNRTFKPKCQHFVYY